MMTISPGSTSRTNLRVDQVERRRFAGQHPRAVRRLADGQRAETVRVARADQFLLRHDDERIRAFDAAQRVDERVLHAADRPAARAS